MSKIITKGKSLTTRTDPKKGQEREKRKERQEETKNH